MVQGIANLTALQGRITERRADPERPGWDVLTLAVEHTAPVADLADLISGQRAQTLAVRLRGELLPGTGAGHRVALRAKWTPDGAMAEPHPEGDNCRRLPDGT